MGLDAMILVFWMLSLKPAFPFSSFTFSKRLFGFSSLSAIMVVSSAEKAMAPPPVLLPGKSHGQRSLVGCSPWGRYESDTTERLLFQFSLSCIGGGNGNPLQYSCLENSRDGGAWWAGLLSMGSHRIGHDWSDSAAAAASAYLRLWVFLLAILIPACASSSLVFHMMNSVYKLNKQSDSVYP